MTIEYKYNYPISPIQLSNLFKSSGINRPYDDLPRLNLMIKEADIIISVWDSDKLIGVLRALTDYSYCCYISDLAVHEHYQKQGLGHKLIDYLQAALGSKVSYVLISAVNATGFYEKMNMPSSNLAYVKKRDF